MLSDRKDGIGMIIEGLQKDIHESSMSSIKKVNNIFGKITKVKEVWREDEILDDLEEIPTKYLEINSNISGIDLNEVENAIKKKRVISLDRIKFILYKALGMRFSVELMSNVRVIMRNNKKAKERLEIRYNRKVISGESDNLEDDIIDKNTLNVYKAMDKADLYRDSDEDKIPENMKKVIESLSTVPNKIEVEDINIEKIQKEGGCDRRTATKVAESAKEVFNKSYELEPDITRDIIDAAKSCNASMYGLAFRLKQGTSLGRKIATDALDPNGGFNGDIKRAAENVKDSIRYTVVLSVEDFTEGYNKIKKTLLSKGYSEFRCKNFYTLYREGKSQQKAVQCVYDKEGLKFELQFHTPESQGAKEVNHPLYEKFRDASVSIDEKRVLDMRMVNISSNVPDPEGVFSILSH